MDFEVAWLQKAGARFSHGEGALGVNGLHLSDLAVLLRSTLSCLRAMQTSAGIETKLGTRRGLIWWGGRPLSMRLQYRLLRSARLQKKCQFDAIRTQGARAVRGCLIVNWMKLSGGARSQLGVVAGRKVGRSVARTRARRLLREVFRRHQHDFREPVAVVLIARPSINEKAYAAVERDFLAAMGEAGLLKEGE